MKPELQKVSTNFSKGLSFAASHLIDNESCQLANNFLFSDGSPTVRQGTVVNASLPSPVVALRKHYKRDGTAYFAAVAGGTLYVSNTSGVFTAVSSESISGSISMVPYDDFLYFTNNSNGVKYFDGSAVAIAGLSSPVLQVSIGDFTTASGWTATGQGSIALDTNFTHIARGNAALSFQTTSTLVVPYNQYQDLSQINGVASTSSDMVQFTTFHNIKANIDDIILGLVNASGSMAQLNIKNLSSWVGCSSDGWTLVHAAPRVLFSQSSNFVWGSCYPQVYVASLSGGAAQLTISDLRLMKTPPIPIANPQIFTPTRFYGSSLSFRDRFGAGPSGYDAQLQGAIIEEEPIPDGTVYYKTTFIKQGPKGILIESNPSQQSSGCILSTTVSTYLVTASGTAVSTLVLIGSYGGRRTNAFTRLGNLATEAMLAPGAYPPFWYYPDGSVAAAPTSGAFYTISTSGKAITAYVKTSGMLASTVFGGGSVRLTDIPLAPATFAATGRNIYRRMNTEQFYRYVYTLTDNSTTAFIDTVPAAVLGANLEENSYPPPVAKYIYAASDQRTYYLNITEDGAKHPSRVRYSLPYSPYYVPLHQAFDVNPGDGTQLVGMFEYMNMQFFLKDRSTWLLDQGGLLSPVHRTYGCAAPNSIATGPDSVFWLSDDGVIEFTLRLKNISQEATKTNIFIKSLPKEYLSNAAGVYYNGLYLLAVTRQGSTVNDAVLVYDITTGLWSIFPDINVNCWSTWGGTNDGARLFYGNNSGLICEFLTGDTDFGQPIPWAIQTKDFGTPTPQEAYRNLYLFVKDLDGSNRTIQITPYYDMVNDPNDNCTIDTSGNSSGIGLGKASLPQKDGASYLSVKLNSSGRCTLVKMDIYAKEESLR